MTATFDSGLTAGTSLLHVSFSFFLFFCVTVKDKLCPTDTEPALHAFAHTHTGGSNYLGVTLRVCWCVTRQSGRTPSCLKALLGVGRPLSREMLLVALSATNMYTMFFLFFLARKRCVLTAAQTHSAIR